MWPKQKYDIVSMVLLIDAKELMSLSNILLMRRGRLRIVIYFSNTAEIQHIFPYSVQCSYSRLDRQLGDKTFASLRCSAGYFSQFIETVNSCILRTIPSVTVQEYGGDDIE